MGVIVKTIPKVFKSGSKHRYRRINQTSGEYGGISDYTYNDTFLGVENPDWKEQTAKNEDATTIMFGDRRSSRSWFFQGEEWWYHKYPGPTSIEWQDTKAYGFPSNFHTFDAGTLSYTEADNEAKKQYVSKVRDMQTSFNGSTFMAEGLQTLRLIKNPAQALRGGVQRFQNRIRKYPNRREWPKISLKERRRILADTWLEYSFGWRPLINDLDDAMRTLADSQYAIEPNVTKLFGYGEVKQRVPAFSGQRSLGSTYPKAVISYRCEAFASVKYIGVWDFNTYALDAQRTGFTPDNWGLAAWEIVPWSFLIDYFTNIGDIISALTLYRNAEMWTAKTVRREIRFIPESVDIQNTPNSANLTVSRGFTTLRKSPIAVKSVERHPWTGLGLIPTAEFSLPGSGTQWLNIASLLASQDHARNAWLTG